MILLHAAAKEGEERIPAGIINFILFEYVHFFYNFFFGAVAVNLFVGILFYSLFFIYDFIFNK